MQKVNVEEQLAHLIKLQALDSRLYNLRRDRKAKPKLIQDLEVRRNEEQAAVKAIEEKIKDNQVKRKQRELDLSTKEEGIKKLQAQLYQLKTNKEYQTMQHEIEGQKADNSRIEDEILVFMEEAENLNKDLGKEKTLFAEAEKHLNEDKKTIEAEIVSLDGEISTLETQRKDITALVDKKVLAHYEKVLSGRDGVALSAVKGKSCQGCFMNLPPQVINEIKMKDKIVTCESCARILYIENEADA
ncbi:MAG: C4-type zinc ribbon domain-containing protein [Candidatus Omnitrophica bacterium]|nr:C4-type zinc ribbon domain-containing protein [Candidatus Omnitrophota bacterium]MDD5310454.1 C4-type zinc ribbon domain-containing protein [Candidatus Omnitrophota bacterium]MDD5546702.1 C4-type zinc ribbon domain-containing protein [Candidatus Omnitrophota bacterium]